MVTTTRPLLRWQQWCDLKLVSRFADIRSNSFRSLKLTFSKLIVKILWHSATTHRWPASIIRQIKHPYIVSACIVIYHVSFVLKIVFRFHFLCIYSVLLLHIIFTALHVMQTRYCDENSVCPSVRPSVCPSVRLSVCPSVCHTRILWQNGRKICPDLYTIRKNI